MSGTEVKPISDDAELRQALGEIREAIDEVDRELLVALNRRAELVCDVGKIKRSGERAPVYVAARERDLVDALKKLNPGPFPEEAIWPVFREIISATRSLEARVRVAYLGPEGTFSHQATLARFGSQVELIPVAHLTDVFSVTERKEAQFGVVPFENTIDGAINPAFDALMESELTICGELLLAVSQNLLSRSGNLDEVRTVASIPQAIGQCRRWLNDRLPSAMIQDTSSTAAAAKLAAADPSVAAIGSAVAAQAYDLHFVARAIEDQRGNATRFVFVGQDMPEPSGLDSTCAAFTLHRDQAGALYGLLEPFARHGVNLAALQSRPVKGRPWEYVFFVRAEGHLHDDAVGKAFEEAAAYADSHKLLGSFPRALTEGTSSPGAAG